MVRRTGNPRCAELKIVWGRYSNHAGEEGCRTVSYHCQTQTHYFNSRAETGISNHATRFDGGLHSMAVELQASVRLPLGADGLFLSESLEMWLV